MFVVQYTVFCTHNIYIKFIILSHCRIIIKGSTFLDDEDIYTYIFGFFLFYSQKCSCSYFWAYRFTFTMLIVYGYDVCLTHFRMSIFLFHNGIEHERFWCY